MNARTKRVQLYRVIRCWACEELLALARRDRRLIVEADAEMTSDGICPVIHCPCGASTILGGDQEPADH